MGGWVGSHRGTIRGSVPLSHSPLGGLLSPSLGLVGRWGRGHLRVGGKRSNIMVCIVSLGRLRAVRVA
eukprot:1141581-Pelagomonas_calceolata.AAC.4